jgi:class 3 adenylate cyclase
VTDEIRTDAAAPAYRGFLFTDLRGFTAFAERYGNTAAAAKVGRFLEIARAAIARYEGAEVKTEGDAIHAVFPSASSAVLCGLEIVDGANEASANEPDQWFDLGVGVHAGEAVETAEGYIGRAVNVAARLCAAARPGEVLVSSTVKGITHASIPVGFISRGRRRLKGIRDPIEVWAVTRDMDARAPRVEPRHIGLGAAGLVGAVILVIVAFAAVQLLNRVGTDPKGTTAPSNAAPSARPLEVGPLAIGAYVSQQFQPPVAFSLGELGWSADRDTPSMLGVIRGEAPSGSVYFLRVRELITNPCTEEGAGGITGPSAVSLLTQLESLQHLSVSPRIPVVVGGTSGLQVDVTVSDAVLAACGGLVGGDVPIFAVGEGNAREVWRGAPGERFRLVSLAVGEEAVALVLSADQTQSPSVTEFEQLMQLGQRIFDSTRFPGAPAL